MIVLETFKTAKTLCNLTADKRDEYKVSQVREKLFQIMYSGAELKLRFQAGVLLGNIGDNRFSENNEDNMVEIPGGFFIRGSEIVENEQPIRRIFLDSYKIGVYPVTNGDFKKFVDDEGYYEEEYWTYEGWNWRKSGNINTPFYWYDSQFNGPNFPLVGINWYEAVAYANWLTKVTGKPYHLPTEAEWEKAARGTDGRKYPWGNDFDENFCNSGQTNLGQPSPVGLFPGGKSPYGCLDMAGNVQEWCLDWYDWGYYIDSPQKNPTGPVYGSNRVIRGGNWNTGPITCNCTCRYFYPPETRLLSTGFRVAMSL